VCTVFFGAKCLLSVNLCDPVILFLLGHANIIARTQLISCVRVHSLHLVVRKCTGASDILLNYQYQLEVTFSSCGLVVNFLCLLDYFEDDIKRFALHCKAKHRV